MISDIAVEHLRRKMDSFTDAAEFRRWWKDDIGRHAARDPRVFEIKEKTKVRLKITD